MWEALAQLGGNIVSNIANVSMTRETNAQNKDLAREQNLFQREMSNTAHQREVADLQAAGLNPMLSAGGNGGSTPSGAGSTMVAPQIEMPDIMAYGISLKQLEQADKKIAIDQANSAAGIAKTLSDTDLNKMKKILAQKGMIKAELEGEGAQVLRNIIKFFKGVRRQPNLGNQNDTEKSYQLGIPPMP